MAELTTLSNPYLSQVERGRHQPSVRVLKLIAEALNVSVRTGLMRPLTPSAPSGPTSG